MTRSIDLTNLQLVVLPGNPTQCQSVELHNRVYQFWRSFWQTVFATNGLSIEVKSDDLCRQDFISLLLYNHEIAGLQFHSKYKISSRAHLHHSYFQKLFSPPYLDAIKNRDLKEVLSIEYLSVDPEWRTNKVGLSIASVLIGVGLKLADDASVDGVVAAARADVGVTKLAYAQGAEPIIQSVQRFNTPCDLMLFSNGSYRYPECDSESALIETLWNGRQDLTQPGLERSPIVAA